LRLIATGDFQLSQEFTTGVAVLNMNFQAFIYTNQSTPGEFCHWQQLATLRQIVFASIEMALYCFHSFSATGLSMLFLDADD